MIPQTKAEFEAVILDANRPCTTPETATLAAVRGTFELLGALEDKEILTLVRSKPEHN